MILVLENKLRGGTLTIQEAENLLDDKFEGMNESSGGNEKGEENALVVWKLQLKKTFIGKCGYCGKYGHNNRILSKSKTLPILNSCEYLITIHTTYQSTYFIYHSHQNKFKNSRIIKIHQVHQKLQRNNI